MASLAGKGNAGAVWPFIMQPLTGMFGVVPDHTSIFVGTGGIAVGASGTTSMYADIPNRHAFVTSVTLICPTAAIGSLAITAQLIRSNNSGTPTDVTLTAATSLKSDFVTTTAGGSVYNIAITGTNQQRVLLPGDSLRVDTVAAGTVSTAPQAIIVVELSLIH